jgi:hypothetical protein
MVRVAVTALCIALIASCVAEQELVMPNPGFGIISTGQDQNGFDRFIPFANTKGNLFGGFATGNIIIPSGATGHVGNFDVTTNSRSRAVVPNGWAPAFWNIEAGPGWTFVSPGGIFTPPHFVNCTGMRTAAPIKRAEYNTFRCLERGGLGGALPFNFSTINVSEPSFEFNMAADRATTTYGMPVFQFYDPYGTLMAQTTATSVDTEEGLWAKGWTHCLAGLPTGNYSIDLINATWDGVGQRIATASVHLYGADSTNYIDNNQYFVAQQYRDFLNREPDTPGLNFWTNEITQCGNASFREPNETYAQCVVRKRVDVARAFWYATEFLDYHPGLRNPPGTSPDFVNSEFVRLSHVLYLRRDPTQEEQDFWLSHLVGTNDYNAVIKGFLNLSEYRMRFEPPPPTYCDPTWEEVNSCQQQGGFWDYAGCWCNWGGGVMY